MIRNSTYRNLIATAGLLFCLPGTMFAQVDPFGDVNNLRNQNPGAVVAQDDDPFGSDDPFGRKPVVIAKPRFTPDSTVYLNRVFCYRFAVRDLKINSQQLNEIKLLNINWNQNFLGFLEAPIPYTTNDPIEHQKELEEYFKRRNSLMAENDRQYEEAANAVLDEAQRNRIEQIALQMKLRHGGFLSIFLDPDFEKQTELAAGDARDVRKVAAELLPEYEKELKELKLKYHAEIRKSTGRDVRDRIDELIGPPFIRPEQPRKKE